MIFVSLYDGNTSFLGVVILKQPNDNCLSFPESAWLFPRLAFMDGNKDRNRDIFKVLENKQEEIKYWMKKYSKTSYM